VNLLAAVECLFDRSHALKIGQARFIFGINIFGINGSTLSSFTGLGNHSVSLNSFGYRCISLDIQELYHLMSLIGFDIGQASLVFGQSLIEIIGQYHLGQARYIFGRHCISEITG